MEKSKLTSSVVLTCTDNTVFGLLFFYSGMSAVNGWQIHHVHSNSLTTRRRKKNSANLSAPLNRNKKQMKVKRKFKCKRLSGLLCYFFLSLFMTRLFTIAMEFIVWIYLEFNDLNTLCKSGSIFISVFKQLFCCLFAFVAVWNLATTKAIIQATLVHALAKNLIHGNCY